MSRRTVINMILSCLLVAYIVIIVPVINSAERNDTFTALKIDIDSKGHLNFLKSEDVNQLLGDLDSKLDTLKRKNLNTRELEKTLNECNRVERSHCQILNDGTLLIEVTPIEPVARIFDGKGSVYVNAEGKRIEASPSFHVDVPVITTKSVANMKMVKKLLPFLREIKTNPEANALVSSLHIDERGDIIVIPNVLGHVINFGDTTQIADKLERLRVFYKEIMPIRGWNAYDTISVKWSGRIFATKTDKQLPQLVPLDELEDVVDERLDDGVMLTDE